MITAQKYSQRKLLLATLVSASLVVVLLLAERGTFSSFFKKIGVYPVAEAYTALYFSDAESLAEEFYQPGKYQTFTFVIANHEGVDLNYSYSVDVYSENKTYNVTKGVLEVRAGETGEKEITLDVEKYPKHSLVYVALPFQQKSIDFKLQ